MFGQDDNQEDHAQIVQFVGNKDASKKMFELAKKLNPTDLPDMQAKVSKGFEDHKGINQGDKEFLDLVIGKIDAGEIDIHAPSTLLNEKVYDALDAKDKGEVDLHAVNSLATIRRIKDLKDLPGVDETKTYQMELMIHEFRIRKEDIEKNFGDVFII